MMVKDTILSLFSMVIKSFHCTHMMLKGIKELKIITWRASLTAVR